MTTTSNSEHPKSRTAFPTAAGILMIIAGAIHLIAGVSGAIGSLSYLWGTGMLAGNLMLAIGAPLIVLGMISLIGGVYALNRRAWGMALAGSICALVPPISTIMGVLAIIFIVISQKEFKQD